MSGRAMDVNELLEAAVKETRLLQQGEVFLVRDLFKGYEWNRIPVKYRLLLGALLLNHVYNAGDEIEVISKTSSNQQRYRKA